MTSMSLEESGSDVSCPACCAILSHGDGSATMVQRRVAELISQNIPPSDAEAHDLQHADPDPAPYLAQVEQRMSELTNELARLSTARAHLQRHRLHVKAILHPLRALPQELLREVFLWSAGSWNDQAMDRIHDSLHHLRPQWVFSQVCRRWRDITLSFPRLWSTLYLNLSGPAYANPAAVPRLAIYLDRSAKHRLDVGIVLPSAFLASDFAHLGPLLRASASRWARWKLDASFEFLDMFFDCHFGSLTHLCVDLYPEYRHSSEGKVAFEHTPLLRHVDYRSAVYDDSRIMLPWEQLCTLKMAELCDSFVQGPLKRLGSVQRLKLQLADSRVKRSTLLSLPSLPLPSLTALILCGLTERDAEKTGQLVSRLDMPSLTELELIFGVDDGSDMEDEDRGIYAASPITFPPFHPSVRLDQLATLFISCPLDNETDDVKKLIDFLHHAHNLQKFVLCDCDISAAVFDALTLRDGHSNLFPRLQILDYRGSDLYEDVRITHILSMLESRRPLLGKETSSRSALTQLFLSPAIARKIGECMMLCFDAGIRGRWDVISTSILVR